MNQAQMLAFYTVVWTMHSEDDRAFFQQLYIDYELMMFKKALTVLRNEEESLDAVSDACLMLMKRISTLRQLSDMSLRRYIIITVEHASINRLRRMKRISRYSFTVDEECTQELAANEMPIEEQVIIAAEKRRLKKAKQKKYEKEKEVIIATHILDNMRKGIIPNINELESIYTFVNLGVTGFLLASETSIGNYPVKSVEMLKMLINLYKK